MAEHTRVWLGRLAAGKEAEHEAFVSWLQSDEGGAQLARYLLTGYRLYQHGELLKVVMSAEEPLAFIRFLRNQKMWPPYWEFVAAGSSEPEATGQGEEHGQVRVEWRVGVVALRGEGERARGREGDVAMGREEGDGGRASEEESEESPGEGGPS